MTGDVGYTTSRQQRAACGVDAPAPAPAVAAEVRGADVELVVPWPAACDDFGAVVRRLAAVVAVHEILRTRIEVPSGFAVPVQVVGPVDPTGVSTGVVRLAEVDAGATGGGSAGRSLLLAGPATVVDAATLRRLADLADGAAEADDPVQYAEYAEWQAELAADVPADAASWWAATADRRPTVPVPTVAGALPVRDPVQPRPSAVAECRRWVAGTDSHARALALLGAVAARLTGDSVVVVAVEIDPRSTGGQLDGALGPYAEFVPVALTVDDDVASASSLTALTDQAGTALATARQFAEWAPAGFAAPPVVLAVAPAAAVVPRRGVDVEFRLDPADPGGLTVHAAEPGLARRWAAAADALLAAADLPVAGVEVVPADGGSEMSGPAVVVGAGNGQSVVARIAAAAASRPDALALRQGDVALSYVELVAAVSAAAAALAATDTASGSGTEPVAVSADRSPSTVMAVLAALVSGVPYVAVPPDHPPARLARILADAGASRLLAGVGRDLGGLADVRGLSLVRVDPAARSALPWPAAPPPDTDAYILFTSGSTGAPKGVAVTHGNLAHYVDAVTQALHLDHTLRWGLLTTAATDLGNTALFGALANGGGLVVLDDEEILDGERFGAAVAAYGINAAKLTPSHLEGLLAGGARTLPTRLLVVGGESLRWETVDHARALGVARVVNHYGPTEATVGAVFLETAADDTRPGSTVPIGRPFPQVRTTVRTAAGARVPVGATGELWIGGPGVARYLAGDPRPAFVDGPDGRLYRTGDVVRQDAEGRLTFLGRRDGQVKIRGHRVETGEVEAALLSHVGVQRAAVLAVAGPDGEPRLAAYVVSHFHPSPTADQLREHVRSRLPETMVPDTVTELDVLPLKGNGKLDVAALPEARAGSTSSVFRAPVTRTEVLVAAVYADLLDAAGVGRDDDFFRLGGHSLLATQAVVRVRQATGVELPVHAIFVAPTVATLAAEIDRLGPDLDISPADAVGRPA